MKKFLAGWLFFSIIFSFFLPYPNWIVGGAVAGALLAVFAK